jgi:iron uptake system component EfeO
MRRVAVAVVGLMVVVSACSSSDDKKAAAPPQQGGPTTINVKLVDGGCDKPTYAAKAGKLKFVAKNTTSRDQEFEILSPGPVIVAEKDPVEAGVSATLNVSLIKGDYELICALGSDAKRSTLTVTGEGGGATLKVDEKALNDATLQYKTWVLQQADVLKSSTQAFATAVESGNVAQAKELYAPGRIPWESIEPVAELFPDIDGLIDSRVDDHEGPNDPKWTGWHRIEKGLWEDNSTEGLAPFAQQLVSDTNGLVAKVQALTIDPSVMTNGAAALIEEAAQGKITGEEERYSHTDLITFQANLDGAKKIIEIVTPVLSTAPGGAELLTQINAKIAKVEAILAPYKTGNTYVSYEQVNDATRNQLKAALADLSETLAEISGTMGLKAQ